MFYRSTLTRSRVHTLTHTQHACTHTHTTHHTPHTSTHTYSQSSHPIFALQFAQTNLLSVTKFTKDGCYCACPQLSYRSAPAWFCHIKYRRTKHCHVRYIVCTHGIIYFQIGWSICLANSNRTAIEHFRSRQTFSYEPYEEVLISP